MREKSSYKLVPGVIIQPRGTSTVYTNDNLTDKVAGAFLAERPNAVALFEVIPAAMPVDAADNTQVTETIAAMLADGKSKTIIETALTGAVVGGVELTKSLIRQHLKAIKAQGNK